MATNKFKVKKSAVIDGTLKRSGNFENGEPTGE